jgi:hypothetical protein
MRGSFLEFLDTLLTVLVLSYSADRSVFVFAADSNRDDLNAALSLVDSLNAGVNDYIPSVSSCSTMQPQPFMPRSQACGEPKQAPQFRSTIVFAGNLYGNEEQNRKQLATIAPHLIDGSRIAAFLIPQIGFNSNFTDYDLQLIKSHALLLPSPSMDLPYRNIGLNNKIWKPTKIQSSDPTVFNPSKWTSVPKIVPGTNVMEATNENLQLAAKAVADDLNQLKSSIPDFDPRTYELTIMILGHGGPKGPVVESTWDATAGKYISPDISQADISSFAKALPVGIRIKYAFQQCYGSDHALALIQARNASLGQCTCGISTAQVHQKAVDSPFVGTLFGPSIGHPFNMDQLQANIENSTFNDSGQVAGGFRLTSDIFLENYYLENAQGSTREALRAPLPPPKRLPPLDQSILSKKLHELISLYRTFIPGVSELMLEQTASDVFEGGVNPLFDKPRNDLEAWIKSEFESRHNWSAFFQIQSDLLHLRLLGDFLSSAPAEAKKEYIDLKACEATLSSF